MIDAIEHVAENMVRIHKNVHAIWAEKQRWTYTVRQGQLTIGLVGALIQDAMPHLDPDQREFLMTGITPAEWDSVVCLIENRPMLDTFERIYTICLIVKMNLKTQLKSTYRDLMMDDLEAYVRNDMQTAYSKTDSETVDEFIAQMNGEW